MFISLFIKSKTEENIYGQNPYDDYYDMQHERRGVALIINHHTFDNNHSSRDGTQKDCRDLENVLKQLRFDVIICNDFTKIQIIKILCEVSKMDHSKSDCLFVAVMTHGEDGILCARDTKYATDTLWHFFTDCPGLTGKPKLFFVQACRGKGLDPGVTVQTETDGPSKRFYTIPSMADILIMYATVEGYYAWRDPKIGGSPFIQALVQQLRENHAKMDLLSLLTFVNRQVAIEFTSEDDNFRYHNKKEMCSIVSMLTRILKFQ